MNGPQHYQMAETLLKLARERADADTDYLVATAKAHAMLAQVAVEVDRRPAELKNSKQWVEATS